MKYIVNRTLTVREYPWLDKHIPKGTEVFEYTGYTYGCISPTGIAYTIKENTEPFFEVPRNTLQAVS